MKKAQRDGFSFTWVEVHNCTQKKIVRNYFTSTTTSCSQYSISWSAVQQNISTHTTRAVLALFEVCYNTLLKTCNFMHQHFSAHCVCWYRFLMYCATTHTELVVHSVKKTMSQHFKMCTKATTHMCSLLYSVHQQIYGVLCEMRTEVERRLALKQWSMWWCEQCECCSWILKKSHKCQIKRYHLWLIWF